MQLNSIEFIEFQVSLRKSKEVNEIQWNLIEFYEIQWNWIEFNEIILNSSKLNDVHEVLWNSMKFNEILWKFYGNSIELNWIRWISSKSTEIPGS